MHANASGGERGAAPSDYLGHSESEGGVWGCVKMRRDAGGGGSL